MTNSDLRGIVVPIEPAALRDLQDVGWRLEHVVGHYQRITTTLVGGVPGTDLREVIDLLNRQVGYLAHRVQDLIARRYLTPAEVVDVAANEREAFERRQVEQPRREHWGEFGNRKARKEQTA